jgi:hypothetical protein
MKVGGPGGPEQTSKVGGTDIKANAQLAAFSKFDITKEIVGRLNKMPNKTAEIDGLINELTRVTHSIGNKCW